MKEVDPLVVLKAYVGRYRTQTEAAEALGVSSAYLSDMLNENRNISETILTQLGLRRTVVTGTAN